MSTGSTAGPRQASTSLSKKQLYYAKLIRNDPFATAITIEAKEHGTLNAFSSRINEYRDLQHWDMRCRYIDIVCSALHLYCQDTDGGKSLPFDWNELVEAESTKDTSDGRQLAAALRLVQGTLAIHNARGGSGGPGGFVDTFRSLLSPSANSHAALEEARDLLLQAASIDPEDPTPYALLQRVAMGLPSAGRTAAEKWTQEAMKRHTFNFEALRAHCYLLMQKWYGKSPRESLQFALRLSDNCPANHPIRLVLIKALECQFKDETWRQEDRVALILEPWVSTKVVHIFFKVYVHNKFRPLDTILGKELFHELQLFLGLLHIHGCVDKSVVQHAMLIQREHEQQQQENG